MLGVQRFHVKYFFTYFFYNCGKSWGKISPVNPQRQTMENISATASSIPARAGFSLWLKGETGSVLARYEREKIDGILPGLFGYHITQIGHYDGGVLGTACRIRNKIELHLDEDGLQDKGCGVLASGASLPFAAHSIDVVVIPHVLEFTPERNRACPD